MELDMTSDRIGPTSPVVYTAISPAGTDSTFAASPIKLENGTFSEPPRKKQKRNKPTLSCEECVERKTKVSSILCLVHFGLQT